MFSPLGTEMATSRWLGIERMMHQGGSRGKFKTLSFPGAEVAYDLYC